ncbi:hypothetical protein GGF37_000345 [Kickxella alabastrina]|nr:hypothetical protein GGF37_000345 [Kickxella alabastrina]
MVKKLAAGELDVAICVTEGLVAGINSNKDASLRLFGTYVDTPLPWAVSVATDARFCSLDDLGFGAKFGISRPGSGSEVMARYAASQYEWATPQFAVLGDINQLVAGTQEHKVDAFLWERTTMQRHYTAESVRYLGTVKPPWPAFSYGATEQFIRRNPGLLRDLIARIGQVAGRFMERREEGLRFVCDSLGYAAEDAVMWAGYVGFSPDGAVDEAKVRAVARALQRAAVIGDCALEDIVLRPGQA